MMYSLPSRLLISRIVWFDCFQPDPILGGIACKIDRGLCIRLCGSGPVDNHVPCLLKPSRKKQNGQKQAECLQVLDIDDQSSNAITGDLKSGPQQRGEFVVRKPL